MPAYDYECEKCSKKFEVTRGFNDKGEPVCPKCKGKARRVYTAPPLIFKGSGFYVTDHKKRSPEGGETSKPEAKKSGGKIETADTKPTKADPPPKSKS
jgi:putative FmdB family regulatory protein